ncbi:hypothetical protein [Thiomicrospira microaerophila]|uniref:hypothetical protein n=1 Tax=Thiomicrospira microaerophila TaxID=406020 RepID=UPI0005C8F2D1|nr:hypothetical protein [Thiomicrospira microaerophila]
MSSQPFEWIRLELLPIAGQDGLSPKIIWWNPEQRILEGEGAQDVQELAESAKQKGSLQTGSGGHIEITDPLHQPTELAAVLAQFYWVIPQPVSASGEDPAATPLNA